MKLRIHIESAGADFVNRLVKCITLAAGTNPEQAIYGDGLHRSEYPIGWYYLPPFEKIQVCWIC